MTTPPKKVPLVVYRSSDGSLVDRQAFDDSDGYSVERIVIGEAAVGTNDVGVIMHGEIDPGIYQRLFVDNNQHYSIGFKTKEQK